MKKLKKLSAILLAMIMTMLVALPAMAANTTVTVPEAGKPYVAYKIFDKQNAEAGNAYIYTIDDSSEWAKVLFGEKFDNSVTDQKWFEAKSSLENGKHEVVLKASVDDNDATHRAIATWLRGKIEDKTITNGEIALNNGNEITGEGYYLIYSKKAGNSTFALLAEGKKLGLNTKLAKNPSITKTIKSVNKTTEVNGPKTSASIGDKIEFEVVVNVPSGLEAADIKVDDTADNGLNIEEKPVVTYEGKQEVTISSITGNLNKTLGFTYTIPTAEVKEGTYKFTYTATLVGDSLNKSDVYVNKANVTYKEVTSQDAISTVVTNLNPNPGDGGNPGEGGAKGPWTLLKVDSDKKYLKGAKFEIYRDAACLNKINFKWDSQSNTYTATADALNASGTTSVIDLTCLQTNANGPTINPQADILGLAGTVYVKETVAPKGYNALTKVLTVNLTVASTNGVDSNGTINFPGQCKNIADTSGVWKDTDKGLAVINTTGSLLPSTGGIGTTIFYIAGAILLIGAVVLLVVRRRMNK